MHVFATGPRLPPGTHGYFTVVCGYRPLVGAGAEPDPLGAPRSTGVGLRWFCAMSEDVHAPGVTSLLLKRPVMTSCEGSRKHISASYLLRAYHTLTRYLLTCEGSRKRMYTRVA